MQKKYIYISIIIGVSMTPFSLQADDEAMSCEYTGKLQQCRVANQNGSTRSINDFVCISSNRDEEILDQIILDVEFKKIDEQVANFLDKLGEDKEKTVTDSNGVIDDIATNLLPEGLYYRQYKALCNGGLLAKRAECTGKVPNITAGNRIDNTPGATACMNLVKNKLDIYAQVAYDTMKINKADVREDRLQEGVVQQLRTKYDRLISMMATLIGNVGRLARGVTHWTPNPKQ